VIVVHDAPAHYANARTRYARAAEATRNLSRGQVRAGGLLWGARAASLIPFGAGPAFPFLSLTPGRNGGQSLTRPYSVTPRVLAGARDEDALNLPSHRSHVRRSASLLDAGRCEEMRGQQAKG
jgi:hypothetical protein